MDGGGQISWGRLVLGALLGLAIMAAVLVLVGPLLAMRVAGGSNYRIKTEAMEPALLPGDWVLVESLLPGQVPPRGAIVVYEHPQQRGVEQIMRVVGLPGERIQIRGGAVVVNGTRVGMERTEDRVIRKLRPAPRTTMPRCINDPVKDGADCRQESWRETYPDGSVVTVLNTQNWIGTSAPARGNSPDDTTQFLVPKGEVFLMGDNRDLAVDSRFPLHGMVPIRNLRYQVWMIHTSLDRSSRFPSLRIERFFTMVR